ncbi:MAG: DEAD/DEAH box helicase, partial [Gemmatimonadetes bacterium]|nr:DEAD/DEAH box helicase [Gemmatimonadota bacterium]
VERRAPLAFLDERFLQAVVRERRGVALFLPTRAAVEEAAEWVRARAPRIAAAHYHGGEPIRVIRPFLEGSVSKPYVLAMTAAGQSALNVPGLDTVIIDDTRFTNVIDRGRNVLTRVHLGANELLQMAGRVHGRVAGGRVFILSDRDIRFEALRPVDPEFQLAGDSERVALTCAGLGVRADALELPVPLDRAAYRRALALLEARGLVQAGRLTAYGRAVEALPVERSWGELLVHADDALLPVLAVMSGIESLHRMTREGRDLSGVVVRGSDHLTAYNLYAEAYGVAGHVGAVYGLPRHLFDAEAIAPWAERRGVLVKALEDAALAVASIYRSLGVPLPEALAPATAATQRAFTELLAAHMPFDLVLEEQTADGHEARVSKTSVCGSWGAVAGTLRYFADRFGVPRASIEGTQLPPDLVRRHAERHPPALALELERSGCPLVRERRVTYRGFELSREREAVTVWGGEEGEVARGLLAQAAARGALRHPAVRRNQPVVEEVRALWRKLGAPVPRLGEAELTAWYAEALAAADSWEAVRALPLRLEGRALVDDAQRAVARALPSEVVVRDRGVALEYDQEPAEGGWRPVVRLHLPEKVARTLVAEELPVLDRPLRFVVHRGQRGAVHGDTLEALQERLDAPYTEAERHRDREEGARGGRPGRGRHGRGGGQGRGASYSSVRSSRKPRRK